ncbi:MAG: hypothetical protein E6J26_03550 [Chloroflexi bacterium]|nr:MAG: hypothetical protein E6J26_03550 [Chloroflexota bacterium]
MRRRSPTALVAILILAAIVAWVDAPDIARPDWAKNLLFWRPAENRDIKIVEGLDLQGGLEVLMQAVPPGGGAVSAEDMQGAVLKVQNRINGLGVTEPLIQTVGSDRIAVQLPGIQDPDLAIKTFGETGAGHDDGLYYAYRDRHRNASADDHSRAHHVHCCAHCRCDGDSNAHGQRHADGD